MPRARLAKPGCRPTRHRRPRGPHPNQDHGCTPKLARYRPGRPSPLQRPSAPIPFVPTRRGSPLRRARRVSFRSQDRQRSSTLGCFLRTLRSPPHSGQTAADRVSASPSDARQRDTALQRSPLCLRNPRRCCVQSPATSGGTGEESEATGAPSGHIERHDEVWPWVAPSHPLGSHDAEGRYAAESSTGASAGSRGGRQRQRCHVGRERSCARAGRRWPSRSRRRSRRRPFRRPSPHQLTSATRIVGR